MSICKKLKYAKDLRYLLRYYVFMQQWENARKQLIKINRFKECHPVTNKIAKIMR